MGSSPSKEYPTRQRGVSVPYICPSSQPLRYQRPAGEFADINKTKIRVLFEIAKCKNCIYESMILIKKKCNIVMCPKYVPDLRTSQYKALTGKDRLSACENYGCILEQMIAQLEVYEKMIEKNEWRGVSNTNAGRPFDIESLNELADHISLFCYRQKEQLKHMITTNTNKYNKK